MKYDPLGFPIVLHEEVAFYNHLEVCSFPYSLILPYVPGPFSRSDGELGCSREVVDVFKTRSQSLPMSYYRSRITVPTPLVLAIPPMPLNSISPPFSRFFIFYVEPKVRIDGVSES